MAKVVRVITPVFFSENEPYVIVLFVEEFENKFRTAMCSNPRYIAIYDVHKFHPELNVFEAKERFMEEMRVGQSEEINLREFTILDLTDNEYTSVRYSATYSKEQDFRVGVYEGYNERETAKKVLNLFLKHHMIRLCD